jgi:glycosyltransferase involved in cell wall biosynthesis
MDISVVIAAHNQRDRLRLVLSGLAVQTFSEGQFEVIVVDDGSTDGTGDFLHEYEQIPIKVIPLHTNVGRCRARNIGIAEARGDLIAFLDGDALPGPDWLAQHWHLFQRYDGVTSGFQYCLPRLEYVQDPQSGLPWEDVPASVSHTMRTHPDAFRVTEAMIQSDFAAIAPLSQEGGYPFPELKLIQDQVQVLFDKVPDSPIGWIGFYPHNASAPRVALEEVGGFDEEMLHSEGWDLAYRLMRNGYKMRFAAKAQSYHLYHHHDFFNPQNAFAESQKRRRAIAHMVEKNEDPRLYLIEFWRAYLWPDPLIPEEMRLNSLMAFHETHQTISSSEMEERVLMLDLHPLRGA